MLEAPLDGNNPMDDDVSRFPRQPGYHDRNACLQRNATNVPEKMRVVPGGMLKKRDSPLCGDVGKDVN
jgi:hypothetical protein